MRNNNAHKIFADNLQKIIDLYWNQNISTKDIAKIIGLAESTLRGYMTAKCLLRKRGQSNKKYTVNDDFFEKIDTEEKAYWLGVLYADGCIVHIRTSKYVVFSSNDKDWLERYKSDISFSGPVLSEYHKKFGKTIYKVKCTSRKMYHDLINKGITERKSNIISFPSNEIVPDNLKHHFIRGYFDGDGSVGLYRNMKNCNWMRLHVSFSCGSKSFLDSLRNYLLEHNIFPINKLSKRTKQNVYILNMSVISGIAFRNYIYKDATVFLQRKYDKFMSANCQKRTFNDYNRVSENNRIKE